jgi:hypothetical protein
MSKNIKSVEFSAYEEGNQETPSISEEERQHYIAEAAYYRALERGLSEGYEQEDWLAAEEEISSLYPSMH